MDADRMRPIPGYTGYFADSEGYIWSNLRNRWHRFSLHFSTKGYPIVRVLRNGTAVTKAVHHLVALAFYGEPEPGQQIRHLNGTRTDNRPSNLAWGTAQENAQDRSRHGRAYRPVGELNPHRRFPERTARGARSPVSLHPESYRGTRNGSSKLTESAVLEIRDLLASGVSQTVVAAQFGVRQASVSAIARGKSWAWLK